MRASSRSLTARGVRVALVLLLHTMSCRCSAQLVAAGAGATAKNETCTCHGPATVRAWKDLVISRGMYDNHTRPGREGCHPIDSKLGHTAPPPDEVHLQFQMTAFLHVDQLGEKVTIVGDFVTWWMDFRLAYNSNCVPFLDVSAETNWLWTPKTEIVNGKTNVLSHRMYVMPSGLVAYSRRMEVVVNCPLDFSKLPYDQHKCTVHQGSHMVDNRELRFVARGGKPGDPLSGLGLVGPQAEALTVLTHALWEINDNKEIQIKGVNVVTAWQTKSRVSSPWHHWDATLGLDDHLAGVNLEQDSVQPTIEFSRKKKRAVELYLLPTLMVCALSYLCFFIDPKSAPARVTCAMISYLTISSVAGDVRGRLPDVAYRVWIDDFNRYNMYTAWLVLMEYGVVTYYMDKEGAQAGVYKELMGRLAAARRIMNACPDDLPLRDFLVKIREATFAKVKKEHIDYDAWTLTRRFARLRAAVHWMGASARVVEKARLTHAKPPNLRELEMTLTSTEPPGPPPVDTVGQDAMQALDLVEADLAVMEYISKSFDHVWLPSCRNHDGFLYEVDIRHALQRFGFYLSNDELQMVLALYLATEKRCSAAHIMLTRPKIGLTLRFRSFAYLLLDLSRYLPMKTSVRFFQWRRMTYSHRTDVLLRFMFPVLMAMQWSYMFYNLDNYVYTGGVGQQAHVN